MLQNFFKTALRGLLKNKRFTALNVLGLAVGIATCLLIVAYVRVNDPPKRGRRTDEVPYLNGKFPMCRTELSTH